MSLIHIYAQKWHSSEIHMGFIATVCNKISLHETCNFLDSANGQ